MIGTGCRPHDVLVMNYASVKYLVVHWHEWNCFCAWQSKPFGKGWRKELKILADNKVAVHFPPTASVFIFHLRPKSPNFVLSSDIILT